MPTTYEKADNTIYNLIQERIEKFYPDLEKVDLTLDVMVAENDNGDHPVKVNGYPSPAAIKITPLKARAKGLADVELILDWAAFKSMTRNQQEALIDKELYYLEVQRDKEENIKFDDLGRPKIRLKKHDYQLGWFREIAVRHKGDSPEVYQAKILWNNDGKTFFPAAQNS